MPLHGVPAELRTFELCNPSGQTTVMLWNAQIVQVLEGGSCSFRCVSTRKNGALTVLTGTPGTVIEPTEQVQLADSYRPTSAQTYSMLHSVIIGVQIRAKPRCRPCQGDQESMPARSSTHPMREVRHSSKSGKLSCVVQRDYYPERRWGRGDDADCDKCHGVQLHH